MGKIYGFFVMILTFMAMPMFAVMGSIAVAGWLTEERPEHRFVRFLAPNILDEQKFIGSPILVTIPLFTFAGYLMAESKTPDRLVRTASAVLGWMPGGLAMVCIVANTFFTTMTGGSGVTIVAIGGMLYPVLRKQGYPDKYVLGLVTAAGAVGLLFFPSPLVAIYSFIAGVDYNKAYVATAIPGAVLVLVLMVHAFWVGIREKVPRGKFEPAEAAVAAWEAKWDLLAPFVVGGGMALGVFGLDEASAVAALYVLVVQVYIYKDLKWRDVMRIARQSVALAGAILIIIMMATALTNWIIQDRIPHHVLEYFTDRGLDSFWEFIIVLNLFLYVLGMVMDEFSAMLVALPLIVPLAARFNMSPFYLAVLFLLHLEIGYISPPAGLNLYITAFRFNAPVTRVYRVVLPFIGLLSAGLLVFIFVPKLSTFMVDPTIAELRAQAEKTNEKPAEAWKLECVQEDRNNPHPCTQADQEKWGVDGNKPQPVEQDGAAGGDEPVIELTEQQKKTQTSENEKLMADMLGGGVKAFYDVFAPVYNDNTKERHPNTCKAVPKLKETGATLLAEGEGEAAKKARSSLVASAAELETACGEAGMPNVEAKLEKLHTDYVAVIDAM